jgi:hypothetical protein
VRAGGFYWVKFRQDNKWWVAEWDRYDKSWMVAGVQGVHKDDVFGVIDETPIKRRP